MIDDLDHALSAYAQAQQNLRNAEHGQRARARHRLEMAAVEVLKADIAARKLNEKSYQERRSGGEG